MRPDYRAYALKDFRRRLTLASMNTSATSILDDPIAQLLLSGEADNPSAAERLYLERAAVSASGRLLEITDAFAEAGLRFLIMGGHAVRYYGIDRQTFDFDFRLSAEDAPELVNRLRRTRLFSDALLTESQSWRGADFQRFQIGVLLNGKEEWLECWFRNHLLAPFSEAYARRETAEIQGRRLEYLVLEDLIRSKRRSATTTGRTCGSWRRFSTTATLPGR